MSQPVSQVTFLAKEKISPTRTLPQTRYVKLSDLLFPVVFKVCTKPAFDTDFLSSAGYRNVYEYFLGRSKFNSTIFGWAGHTPAGEIVSNVSGKKRDKVHGK